MSATKKIVRRSLPTSENKFVKQLHPLLQRVYAARGVIDDKLLDYSLSVLEPMSALKGIDEAVQLLVEALAEQQHILIVAGWLRHWRSSSIY